MEKSIKQQFDISLLEYAMLSFLVLGLFIFIAYKLQHFVGSSSWPSLWGFLQNPHYRDFDKSLSWKKIALLYFICFIAMIIVNLLQSIMLFPVLGLVDEQNTNMMKQLEALKDEPLLLFFSLAIFAPISEELWFRFGLKKYSWKIMAAWSFFMVAMIFFLFIDITALNIIFALSISFFFAIGVYFIKQKEKSDDAFWYRNFIWIFWGSSFIFGLAHYTNFLGGGFSLALLYLIIIYLLGRGLLGGILAYSRMRLGIIYAILLHSLNNALPALVFIFVPEEYLQPPMAQIMTFLF